MDFAKRMSVFWVLGCSAWAACGDDDGVTEMADVSATSDAATGLLDASPILDSTSSTKKGFGELCSADADCESDACFMGGSQTFCSIRCTEETEVAVCLNPPTTGDCNNQGFCRKP